MVCDIYFLFNVSKSNGTILFRNRIRRRKTPYFTNKLNMLLNTNQNFEEKLS